MATIKCNEPKYTILTSGGKPIVNNVSAVEAAAALTAAVEDDACPEPPAAPEGLRLTYTAGNMPHFGYIPTTIADWNTFFDLPANGTPFTSMVTAGNMVTLIGGSGITIKASLFRTSDKILKIEDDVDCVVAVAGGKNAGAISLCPNLTTVTLNGVTTAGEQAMFTNAALTTINMLALETAGKNCFDSCPSVTTFNMPALETAGDSCFQSCTSATTFTLPALLTGGGACFNGCTSVATLSLPALQTADNSFFEICTSLTTINMPVLTALGTSTGNDAVFNGCTALKFVTVPTALATVNGGNPDGDLVYAVGSFGATITYV